jgi:hypothetical protein
MRGRPPFGSGRKGLRRALPLLAVFALLTPAWLAAVPPPPIGFRHGPTALCTDRFGVRLTGDERAEQYARAIWLVSGPNYQIGIRSDLGRLEGPTTRVAVPGLGAGERQRVREYPGNRYRGWIYAFPIAGGATLRIASDQFRGTGADRPVLQRILVGASRDALCASGG